LKLYTKILNTVIKKYENGDVILATYWSFSSNWMLIYRLNSVETLRKDVSVDFTFPTGWNNTANVMFSWWFDENNIFVTEVTSRKLAILNLNTKEVKYLSQTIYWKDIVANTTSSMYFFTAIIGKDWKLYVIDPDAEPSPDRVTVRYVPEGSWNPTQNYTYSTTWNNWILENFLATEHFWCSYSDQCFYPEENGDWVLNATDIKPVTSNINGITSIAFIINYYNIDWSNFINENSIIHYNKNNGSFNLIDPWFSFDFAAVTTDQKIVLSSYGDNN